MVASMSFLVSRSMRGGRFAGIPVVMGGGFTLVLMGGRFSLAGLFACACLLACSSEKPVPLTVNRNQAPSADCTLDQLGGEPSIESGVFDLAIGDRAAYIMIPLVENPGAEDLIVTTARVDVVQNTDEGAITLRFTCTEGGCDEWDLALCDGALDPTCPVVPARGRASFAAPVLPRVVTGYFQGQMDAAVREGRIPATFFLTTRVSLVGYAGEREVIGPSFAYDIQLCLGCLVEFPPGTDDPSLPGIDCCGGGAPIESCYPGQDEPIDCRSCLSSLPEICNMGRTSCRF
jgi:hypothetical protein